MLKKILDLIDFLAYGSGQLRPGFRPSQILSRLPSMKLVIRIFALSIAVAGITAATTSKTAVNFPSHQSATASMPAPVCGGHWQCAVMK
jgi:hypothetical protein